MNRANDNAPIILFTYNRLQHTKRAIEALKDNFLAKESDLYIFSDGPRIGEEERVEKLREYLRNVEGFQNVYLTERQENLGLAMSVIQGVTEIIERYGKVIVLEDDLVSNRGFLTYMNQALREYENCNEVFSISAYSHLSEKYKEKMPQTYFLKITSSWGWATWLNRWNKFDNTASGYRRLLWDLGLRRKFNYDGTVNYYKMLIAQMNSQNNCCRKSSRKIDSWAIRWYWTCFKESGINLYPRDSYVKNIGFDGSGIHCKKRLEKANVTDDSICKSEFDFPTRLEEIKEIREKIKSSLREV